MDQETVGVSSDRNLKLHCARSTLQKVETVGVASFRNLTCAKVSPETVGGSNMGCMKIDHLWLGLYFDLCVIGPGQHPVYAIGGRRLFCPFV